MIVQNAPQGAPHFVMTMSQHTSLSAQFATHFGNERFESINPPKQMLHVIAHHDDGWRELDQSALRDPATGLPYNLVQTPFEHIVATSSRSPDVNGEYHPYCELISSMHSWGLYNGRYGMSDKVLLDSLAADNRTAADGMLAGEVARQNRIKDELGAAPDTADWIADEHLFQNYKQLQFFDTLALYFNCVPEGERETATFAHVPLNATEDTDVAITPLSAGVYSMAPYPFDRDELAFSFDGRYLAPVDHGDDVRAELDAAAMSTQGFKLARSSS